MIQRLGFGLDMKLFRKSVDLLEGACKVLSEQVVDDVHLCAHTSELIQNILVDVKKTLIRVQKPPNTSGTNSRDQSLPPTGYNNMGGDGQGGHRHFDKALPTLPDPNYHDSLPEVQAKPMSELMSQTFIAPPNYNFDTNQFDLIEIGSADEHSVLSDNPADWVAMPLDGLMNNGDGNVDQGFHSIGPMVGSRDMLELITNQDYTNQDFTVPADFNAMAWATSTGQFQGFHSPHL
jgi:hypothetical protein